jgi:hypothetical protein
MNEPAYDVRDPAVAEALKLQISTAMTEINRRLVTEFVTRLDALPDPSPDFTAEEFAAFLNEAIKGEPPSCRE